MRSTQPQSERLFWHADLTPGGREVPSAEGELPATKASRKIVPEEEANLIGSLTDNGLHMPVIDIDRIPVKVVESSTPGNFHLYIDKEMDWATYKELLGVLYDAGIIEEGYYHASVDRKATFVRKPGVRKNIVTGAAAL